MAAPTPPPLPPTPLPYRPPGTAGHEPHRQGDYQVVADTVGFVPSMRKSDNVMQAWAALVGAILGLIAGVSIYLLAARGPHEWTGFGIAALLGGLVGAFAAVLLAGTYLAVRNLVRPGRK